MKPWLDDGDVRLYHGDVIDVLRQLPAGAAQTCVTSPPYWGLRDYGTGEWTGGDADCDHQRQSAISRASSGLEGAKTTQGGSYAWGDTCGRCGARRVDQQLGLEASPELYVERMVAVFREVWRVLRDDGTLWLNLGDSYAGGGGFSATAPTTATSKSGKYGSLGALKAGGIDPAAAGLKPKDLVGIPWRVAFALQADGWYLRSDIIWSKPNPMPESVSDRPTKAHEYLFLLSKRPRYFYDSDAVREPHARLWDPATNGGNLSPTGMHKANGAYRERGGAYPTPNPAGRNLRSVWEIATQPTPEAHFATFPQALVEPCILAGTSERGECSQCGAPWQRRVKRAENIHPGDSGRNDVQGTAQRGRRADGKAIGTVMRERFQAGRDPVTTGWAPTCECGVPARPQTVLDPFVGSGTTALVARRLGRHALGIDLNAEYLAIAAKRTQQLSLLGGAA